MHRRKENDRFPELNYILVHMHFTMKLEFLIKRDVILYAKGALADCTLPQKFIVVVVATKVT